MGLSTWRRLRLAAAFVHLTCRYWAGIYPSVRRELRTWRLCAATIPDPHLRAIACGTELGERGNYEGAAAFAALAPRQTRALVVRAVVAFQLAYDYTDSLAELPAPDRVANGRGLHEALHSALSPGTPHPDYYAGQRNRDDGGYLRTLVDACREAVVALPSWEVVAPRAREMSRLFIEYQVQNHVDEAMIPACLTAFAAITPDGGHALHWWEAAAGGASSMVVFSLIAAGAERSLTATDAQALERAYVPWIGALHVLLDSLVDWPHDIETAHHSLVAHYASPSETAERLEAIARTALSSTQTLPHAREHQLLLVAMAGLYLSKPEAGLPHAAEATKRLLAALGALAPPVLIVHRTRRLIERWSNRN